MTLITRLDDERLVNADSEAMNVLRDSLRAALQRAEKAEKEVTRLREAVSFTFPTILRLIQQAYENYSKRHPDWWKRIERTPIPNDLSVVIGEYIASELRRRAEREG